MGLSQVAPFPALLAIFGGTSQLLLAHSEYFWTNRPNFDGNLEPLHCAMTALAVSTTQR